MQAVPALLTNNTEEFIYQVNSFSPYFKRFSIDIIDGKFANNVTLQAPQILELFTSKKLAVSPDIIFDFDLMVMDYESRINEIEKIQQYVRVENVVIYLRPLNGKPLPIKQSFNIGLSFTPQDNVEDVAKVYNISALPTAQIMTITPGFQGQKLMPGELQKIKQLRQKGFQNKIYIDGGVNDTTLPEIIALEYQPDYLCMGSFLSKAVDIQQRSDYIKSILQ